MKSTCLIATMILSLLVIASTATAQDSLKLSKQEIVNAIEDKKAEIMMKQGELNSLVMLLKITEAQNAPKPVPADSTKTKKEVKKK